MCINIVGLNNKKLNIVVYINFLNIIILFIFLVFISFSVGIKF